MSTKPTYGNCLFASLYLIWRGKVKKVVMVTSDSKWYPHHYVTVNKNDHILHFENIHPHSKDTYAPWWFEGHFIGIRKSLQEEVLAKTNKKVIGEYGTFLGATIFLSIIAVCFVPWLLAWLLFCPIWTSKWTVDALRKRWK